jgi:type I restriction enzyme S subunit
MRPPREEAPRLYKESPIGWIPKEWEIVTLENACDQLITYGIVQPGPHVDGGVPFVQTRDLSADALRPEQLDRTSLNIAAEYERSKIGKGDILCGIRASVGELQLVPQALEGANISRGVARVSPNRSFVPEYLFGYMAASGFQSQLSRQTKGTTYAEITLPALRNSECAQPSHEEQLRIAEILGTVTKRLSTETSSLSKLHAQKQALMQDLLTGRVRVRTNSSTDAEETDV